MASLKSLFDEPEDNLVFATKRYIECLGVRVTGTTIEDELLRHPNYPSILSVSDCLTAWSIENAALQIDDTKNIHELSTPFMAGIAINNSMQFVVVRELAPDSAEVIDETGIRKVPIGEFLSNWRGTALLAETNEKSGEKDFETKRRSEKLRSGKSTLVAALGLLVVAAALYSWSDFNILPLTLLGVNLTGLVMAWVLVRVTVSDSTNGPGICQAGGNFNCKKVLDSPAAKIFGVSASDIGLLFFFTNFAIVLLSGGASSFYFTILTVAGIASLPYTVFSVIYQWRVVKAWCILCLSVQALLWINFGVLMAIVDFGTTPSIGAVLNSLAVLAGAGAIWLLVKPVYSQSLQAKTWKRLYVQLKNNKEIFNAFLKSQPHLEQPPEQFRPVVIGNPESANVITMVTNPYCTPCSQVHKKLESILESSLDLQVHVIFYACSPHGKAVSKHMIAMYEQGLDVGEAMAAWYTSGKDYKTFAARFPVEDPDRYQAQADAHCDWAKSSHIPHTPYVFVNGFMSPKEYEIEEAAMLIQQ
ncbi:MAG TPA: vitamin K epoxide reductase family protein [Cyclobacteriaceae bacterium]|nr:vitamin K epoxide reductase family protein [Cyclobacteriaceae bacterium]